MPRPHTPRPVVVGLLVLVLIAGACSNRAPSAEATCADLANLRSVLQRFDGVGSTTAEQTQQVFVQSREVLDSADRHATDRIHDEIREARALWNATDDALSEVSYDWSALSEETQQEVRSNLERFSSLVEGPIFDWARAECPHGDADPSP